MSALQADCTYNWVSSWLLCAFVNSRILSDIRSRSVFDSFTRSSCQWQRVLGVHFADIKDGQRGMRHPVTPLTFVQVCVVLKTYPQYIIILSRDQPDADFRRFLQDMSQLQRDLGRIEAWWVVGIHQLPLENLMHIFFDDSVKISWLQYVSKNDFTVHPVPEADHHSRK